MLKKPLKGSVASKRLLTCWKAVLSVDDLSNALKITPEEVVAKFRDGRITSWFAEIWGAKLFGYQKHLSSNHPGSDASIDIGLIGPYEISVRTVTNSGIKFQKSKDIGSSRGATQTDVYNAISDVERVVVVDIRKFPEVTFIPLDSKWLLRHAHNGTLTANGLSAARLYGLLGSEFDLKEESFDLTLALTETSPSLAT